MNNNNLCQLCPRKCGIDRSSSSAGFCHSDDKIRIARYSLHNWEEPPISGTNGSGTIFFSGCNLRCIYCQNHDISHNNLGWDITADTLEKIIFELEEQGAHNINFVTPTHYSDIIASVLHKIKHKLKVPIVWNSSAYECIETLRNLDGLIDIYLPDFKYADPDLAKEYSKAYDYPSVAMDAIKEMYRQTNKVEIDNNGLMKKGMIVRHLVLPGCRKNSISALEILANEIPPNDILISIMSQYTPDFAIGCGHKNLERKITGFEYTSVVDKAIALGFDGFFQERSSANKIYTPDFYGDFQK